MRLRSRVSLVLLPIALICLCGCGGGSERAAKESPGVLKIVATTGQVGDVVGRVGGDRVRVTALMGPGIDPHLYKASAGDVERLRTADAIFYNGLHLETKMGDVIERMGARTPTLALAETLPGDALISPPEFEGLPDPHVWFDVELWSRTPAAVAETLARIDPQHAREYRTRAADYTRELEALHAYALETFSTIPETQRVLITAHDAFNYLGRAYGLEVRGVQGISTSTEAGTGDIQDMATLIVERRIPAFFVETSVSPRSIEAVRQAVLARGFAVVIGGDIYSDALGDADSPAGTYPGMVRHNVDTITAALRGEVAHDDE